MSLSTISKFYYGHRVDSTNYLIDFAEGAGPELTAELPQGSYTLTDYAAAVANALNSTGALTYVVSVSRTTRVMTITSTTTTFSLLVSSGSHASTSAFSMMGFTGSDRTGGTTYSGDSASGSSFTPQFILQDHVSTEDSQGSVDETVNISASGTSVEVIRFGTEKFLKFSIKWATNRSQPSVSPITHNPTGLDELRAFMQYIVTKGPIEYMPDKDTPSTFQSVFLESTGESSNGTSYELKERYDRGLPGYYDTSVLKFRLIE